jgi:hypothetical protein
VLLKSIVIGRRAGKPSIASVTTICRRSGVTGRSTPIIAASSADHAPAAQMTVPVRTSPRLVRTVVTWLLTASMPRTSQPVTRVAPSRRAAVA